MSLEAFGVFTVWTALATQSDPDNSLDGVQTRVLRSGVLARVTTGAKAAYELDITSAAVADGVNIIKPRNGPGRWFRLVNAGTAEFLTQPTWFINALAGSDANDGRTSVTALASWAELSRRWDRGTLQQTTDVFIETDLPEPVVPQAQLTGTDFLRIHGAVTATLHSGSITAKTDLDPASQQPSEITDAAVGDWDTAGPGGSSLIKHRIRLTSGANVGAVAWLGKRISPTVARTSPFGTQDTTLLPPPIFPTQIDPGVGDTYDVEQLTIIEGFDLDVKRPNDNANFTLTAVLLEDVQISSSGKERFTHEAVPAVLTVRSRCNSERIAAGFDTFSLSAIGSVNINAVSRLFCLACLVDDSNATFFNISDNSRVSLNSNTLVQGVRVQVFGGCTFDSNGMGVFDSPGNALTIFAAADASFSGLVWGDSNTGFGIFCQGTAQVAYPSAAKPTLTGAGGDTSVGNAGPTAYAAIPLFNGGAAGDGAAVVER